MLILHDMLESGNCYKVRLLLALQATPFKSIAIAPSAKQSSTPEFLALNPKGAVPFLQYEDGRTLAESNAILLHLAEGTDYLPSDAFERAKVYEWLFFEQYSHEPNIAVRISLSTIANRAHLATEEKMAALMEGGMKALFAMETQLAKTPFIVGEQFTIADIALYAYTHEADKGGFDLSTFPKVEDWLKQVRVIDGFVSMDWLPSV